MNCLIRPGSNLLAIGIVITIGSIAAAFPSGTIILKQGDAVGTSTVSSLNTPFTDGNGKVGFVAALADAQRAIWYDTGPVFLSGSALPLALTGGEGTMGVSNTGGFIYSPSCDGNDCVYGQSGVFAKRTDPAPDFPGQFISFASRPTMKADGSSYWMSGLAATPTGSSTNRVFYKRNPAGVIGKVFAGGDVISGFTLSTGASNFDYDISDDSSHHVHIVDTTAAAASNTFIYLDGALSLREGSPNGTGDNWLTFDTPSINNSGNYLISGTTSGAAATNAYIAYNGVIKQREGDTIDGILLANGAAVRAASVNDNNAAAYIWGWGTGVGLNEVLYYSSDANNLSTSALKLLRIGDTLDVNNDSIPDWQVFDFEASGVIGPGLDLAEDGRVCVELTIGPIGGAGTTEAIVCMAVPEPSTLSLLAVGGLALIRRRR